VNRFQGCSQAGAVHVAAPPHLEVTMVVRILGWLAGFAAGFLVTLVAGVIIMPTLRPVRTLMLVAGSLAGLALKAWRRRARPARIVERRARRMTVQWRWRGDGLGA
jgi:hypothetical protein